MLRVQDVKDLHDVGGEAVLERSRAERGRNSRKPGKPCAVEVSMRIFVRTAGMNPCSDYIDIESNSGANTQRFVGDRKKLLLLELLEESGKNWDLAFPVSGSPYFAKPGVEGLVELALNV